MRHLILIRHAKSSWADSSLRDMDRPLNHRGFRDAPKMAKWLYKKIEKVDTIISSPAMRARTTASYFAKYFFDDEDQMILSDDLYHAYDDQILKTIQGLTDSLSTVLLFGHNPGFTSFANNYTDEYITNIPTCGIAAIEYNIRHWRNANFDNGQIEYFCYPKKLRK